MITTAVRAADGVLLALHRWRTDRVGRPAVLLIHGAFSGHPVFLRGGLAAYLAERGFDVWLGDLRHHGASAREPAPRQWRFEDWIVQDAPALVAGVREAIGSTPLAWAGHSSGGVVGLCWQARGAAGRRAPRPVDALVAFGSPGPGWMNPVRWSLAALAVLVCRGLGRFPSRALRFGSEDEGAEILAQWMGWNLRGGWVGTEGFDYYAALAGVRTPLIAVAGAADTVFAPPRACRRVVTQIGAPRKVFLVYPHLSHRGLVLDPRARDHCWLEVAGQLQQLLETTDRP